MKTALEATGMFQTFKSFNTFKLFNEPISLGRLERFERLKLLEPAARSILCALLRKIGWGGRTIAIRFA
jgi:hypothetical protein